MKDKELRLRGLKPLTHEVERVTVVSNGEGSGEGIHATLLSKTVRYISLADLARGWGLLR